MSAYFSASSNKTFTKNNPQNVKSLYRRNNKTDATRFNMNRQQRNIFVRTKHSEQELDQWLTQIFSELFSKNRFDSNKYTSKEKLVHAGLQIGAIAKKIYFSLEILLNNACIPETLIKSKDIWLFALYQTLRTIEQQSYQGQHLYTSLTGKRNSQIMIQKLNKLIPNWLSHNGKINKPKQPM